jgi:hypothetical protein
VVLKDIMRSVEIRNKEILGILNEFRDMWWDIRDNLEDYYYFYGKDAVREEWISEEYKSKIMAMGCFHDGYPQKLHSFSLMAKDLSPGKCNTDLQQKYSELDSKFQLLLGTQANALGTVYPPGGFISWHNNANASAYNLIFTWSENGEGYWKHVDPYTGKNVIVQDVPGWQCKAFYFGAYEDSPEDIVYHMASTDCWRMTISYIFDREHKQYWEDVIEEIEMDD